MAHEVRGGDQPERPRLAQLSCLGRHAISIADPGVERDLPRARQCPVDEIQPVLAPEDLVADDVAGRAEHAAIQRGLESLLPISESPWLEMVAST